ncbi:MAG: tetratricopeptide repeat protein [Alphaproteobacteria bacterium]|nr:tetratricopeptide repeat protein [Alphaproteobacteria bacterium]
MSEPTPNDLNATLQTAVTHCNAGRYSESASIADQLLQHQANNPDALHISGFSRLKMGMAQDALPLLQAAVKAKKSNPTFANSLAQALLALGQIDAAAAAVESLARKNKLTAAGLNTLGDCRLRQGDPAKARACFEKALKLQPNLDPARVNLGEALKEAGDLAGAIAHYKSLVQTHPHIQSAWRNLGLALQDAELFKESIPPLEHYATLNPSDVPSRLSLGSGRLKTGDSVSALGDFELAIDLAPNNAEAWNTRGLALRTLDRHDEAETAFRRALEIDPKMTVARVNLAHMVNEIRGTDAALTELDEAIAQSPDDPKCHMDRSVPLLLDGRIAEGWDGQRWRFRLPPDFSGRRDHPLPPWDGSDLADKSILVWGEQGIGDELLHASMIPDLLKMAKHVVIETEQRLVPLFARSFPQATVVARTSPTDPTLGDLEINWQTAAGDLCEFLRPDLSAFPKQSSYLASNPDHRSIFVDRYSAKDSSALRVGIAWHTARAKDGWQKSIPLELWSPILATAGTMFVSLQYGEHSDEIARSESATGCPIMKDPEVDSLENLDAFASQVAAMDLVISNSNTAAHMAGALGVPVWTMVPRAVYGGAPWYWFKDGSASPWYDSMTLYRQTRWHDWGDTIAHVAADLSALSASR